MTPATHAAVGAAAARAVPRLWIALPLAFFSHFVCDAIYHFEAFYPLSQKLGTTHNQAMLIAFAGVGAALAPFLWAVVRGSRDLMWFTAYLAAITALRLETASGARLAGNLALAGAVLGLSRSEALWRWVICGLAANLPDLLRDWIGPLDRLHVWAHYDGYHDLGDWLYRLFRGGPSLFAGRRFDDPAYVLGYFLEIVIEAAILLGCLYYAGRGPVAAEGSRPPHPT